MGYEEVFAQFWEQVKESAEQGRFAKLTMAKTIGKPELKNIFARPVYSDQGFMVLLKLRYLSRETEDIERQLTLEQSLEVIKEHLRKPFFSVILFTTTEDVTFKINKKGAGSISINVPSFTDIVQPKSDED